MLSHQLITLLRQLTSNYSKEVKNFHKLKEWLLNTSESMFLTMERKFTVAQGTTRSQSAILCSDATMDYQKLLKKVQTLTLKSSTTT